MIAFIIIGLVLLMACLIWLIHRRTVASDGLMRQDWLIDELPCDSEDLAGVILEIENKGLIKWEWKTDVATYMVSTPSQSVVSE
jgi:hypothetical protein